MCSVRCLYACSLNFDNFWGGCGPSAPTSYGCFLQVPGDLGCVAIWMQFRQRRQSREGEEVFRRHVPAPSDQQCLLSLPPSRPSPRRGLQRHIEGRKETCRPAQCASNHQDQNSRTHAHSTATLTFTHWLIARDGRILRGIGHEVLFRVRFELSHYRGLV